MGLIYSVLTITLRANQNVTGLALTTFGVGVGNFFGGSLIKLTGSEVPSIALSATSGYFSKCPALCGQGGLVRQGLPLLRLPGLPRHHHRPASRPTVLKRTRVGLHLRAVGESPATADAAGISVTKYKYLATCIGSMVAGLGGLYYVMDYACGVWSNNAFGDRGWLAIALVIFTIWRPNVSILASILFGGFYILYLYIPSGTEPGGEGALQDAPLCRHPGGAHHRLHAQKAGGSAPREPGSRLLPGGALTPTTRERMPPAMRQGAFSALLAGNFPSGVAFAPGLWYHGANGRGGKIGKWGKPAWEANSAI